MNLFMKYVMFMYYIAMGSIQILVVKATMTNGKIEYNTSSVICFVELCKLIVSDVVERTFHAEERAYN